jgi:amidophosphoribosyltransferase
MSDPIRHECGIAVVRLKKPLAYYHDKYNSVTYGLERIFGLMAKQRNRGQDGMGIGCCKLDMPPGQPYMFRVRSTKSAEQIGEVLKEEMKQFQRMERRYNKEHEELRHEEGIEFTPFKDDPDAVKEHFELAGEILLGHLRYGTSGEFGKGSLHPYIRRSTWPTRSLMVMGNFNLTNTHELNRIMMSRGQHPVFGTDTQSVLEEIGFQLDESHTALYRELRDSDVPGDAIPAVISDRINVTDIIRKSAETWDGGYTIAGAIGNGDLFVMRDPNGIRPCHMYEDDEIVAFASERVALMTIFEVGEDRVSEVPPAHVAVMKATGEISVEPFTEPRTFKPCSFEKIYFSRPNDSLVYRERKELGAQLVPPLAELVADNWEKTVLSFIPNTAETAYHGFMDGLRVRRRKEVYDELVTMHQNGDFDEDRLADLILSNWPRSEKIAHKDIKMRTFIAQESGRDKLVSSVYDITYGVVESDDNLVVIDDSIVRGTTLRKSVLRILSRVNPKRIIVLSTAPQIRYPDCYGIDMAEMSKFIAFEAAIDLLKQRGLTRIINETHSLAIEELQKEPAEMTNVVKRIYEPFTDQEISDRIAEMIYPRDVSWRGELCVIYQSIESLHAALGSECGDWYFSGNYPTPGGYQIVNRAFVNFCEKKGGRAYTAALPIAG